MLDNTFKDTWNTREDSLGQLEIENYKLFLQSPLWLELKNKANKRDNFKRCYVCGCLEDLELHHLSYKELNTLRNVRSVCREHHQAIHDYAKEQGISVRRATRDFRKNYRE